MNSFPMKSSLQEALRLMGSGDLRAATQAIQRGLGMDAPAPAAPAAPAATEGDFKARVHRGPAGSRPYKLFTPQLSPGERAPLIVMLHGCTQDPDDFATGTRMNEVAGNCFVAYPGQTQGANPSRCWNWFKEGDQGRDRGEPAIVAEMVRELIRDCPIDPARVHVAGLSAGAAMAVILGRTYSELFAAVGVHSGLPYAAASDVTSAFAAMRDASGARVSRARGGALRSIPTIVFHGDRDTTVHPCNGTEVLAQGASEEAKDALQSERARVTPEGGHAYTREILRAADGRVLAEHWLVHGAGHAWSGGSPQGSYTDPRGPDASAEMARFFREHPRT